MANQKTISRRDLLIGGAALGVGGAAVGAAVLANRSSSEPSSANPAPLVIHEGPDLIYASATELLSRFESGDVTPLEVLEAQITRATEIEPEVNAFIFEYFDEARVAAAESERRYRDGNPRALEGITVVVKEADIAGRVSPQGSLSKQDNVAERNHPIVDRLLAAGAIIHARSTMPEFGMAGVTWSKLSGVTRNPWNLDNGPGGSSGGSAASLAAGTTTLATGADGGGSNRIPASLTGLYGYKPPFGRVANTAGTHLSPGQAYGPLARTVDDMIVLYNVISGPDPVFPASTPGPEIPLDPASIKGMRIAVDFTLGYNEIDPDVQGNTEAALGVLEDLGATLAEVDLGWNEDETLDTWEGFFLSGLAGAALRKNVESMSRDDVTSYVLAFYERSKALPSDALATAAATTSRMNESLFAVLSDNDVLVSPTIGGIGVAADFDPTTDDIVINGKSVDPFWGWLLTYPFNLMTWNPAITVPTGRARNNIPTGMQIVGSTYDELTMFRVASNYGHAIPPLFADEAYPDFRREQIS